MFSRTAVFGRAFCYLQPLESGEVANEAERATKRECGEVSQAGCMGSPPINERMVDQTGIEPVTS
jgi:hypothetical protein